MICIDIAIQKAVITTDNNMELCVQPVHVYTSVYKENHHTSLPGS